MIASGIIQKIAGRLQARQQSDAEAWAALVRTLADGRTPDEAKAVELMGRLGKSPADLEAAVALVVQRREWRKQVDAMPGLQQERDRLAARMKKAEADYEAAVEKARRDYAAVVEPADARIREIGETLKRAETARTRLIETSDDDTATQRAAELRRQAQAKRAQAGLLKTSEADIPARPLPPSSQRRQFDADDTQKRIDEQLAADRQELANRRAERDRLTAEADDLDRQAEEAMAARLAV